MLFDSIINLFKTICIGIIAFSPLLVYKLTDDGSSTASIDYSIVETNSIYPKNDGSRRREEQQDSSGNISMPSFNFSNSNNIFSQTTPPPPPPPPVDAPIDKGVWVLIIFGIGYGYLKNKKVNKISVTR